ncbi:MULTISPECIES: M1 family metallopeptidase [Streptococcus]|jgi:aminopeptidase N|uniref:Aminopeptidase n=1 Tax=Streptococcus alactolyticus TaxID=29389 RepID=A0A6N7WNX3_STRAY|nr:MULTISPECIES: M1 family metallopeptidase [Streptococcus]MDE2587014.1 M1 family metallopeptidase [Lactobacillales bacterium]MCF2665882.1 M1 family metallopeptidase [Streptococcus alactolyticus]MCF2677603.1 M1 family metallopeptidase [Streptococcus alactolyticus]MCI6904746.1 M1 family metallopeptidase [Streptococcus alactolyticus]MDD7361063.1 M1 family metallopeptidase [Streptococcus alactolyticus]
MKTVEHFIEKFVPENYNIFLDINRTEKSFSGNVAITGEALDNVISFHQKDLTIASVLLDNQNLDFKVDNQQESLSIDLPETGTITLVIEFSGKITDNMTGIYPSYYTVDGMKKEVISTQFESHFAREAFPCVDEPEAKATFDLSIKFDQAADEIVLSNMPEVDAERRKETGLWTFDTTPRMSSYLLAFALGDLQGKTASSKNGTEVGVFSTKAHNPKTLDFALDIAVRVIDFYEDYFGVRYPIPLSYHVALPDFSAGAMENWGLVTYREVYLLVDENSTVKSRQNVALVVAHELAHQWFGNLVTMKWWDDLWLNESFANMMEYVSIDAIEPSWNIFEDFQTTGVPLALQRDATDGVQSVHVAVNHPDEINTLFDPAIVYAKGSRLMHMLRRWLGDDDFRAGLKIYFEKHQYSNTIGHDLWDALSEASGKDVAAFMDAWLEQPGYPVVTAEVVDDTLVLSQKQFFIGEGQDQNRIWPIPLNTNWTGLPETLTEERLAIPNFSQLAAQNEGALRLNTANTAHYITNYKGQLLKAVLNQLTELDTTSKLQVVQERRLLAESGEIPYAELIPLLTKLTDETSYLVSEAIAQVVDGLDMFMDEGSEAQAEFKALVNRLMQKNYDRLGFEPQVGESDEDEMVRQKAISLMLYADNADAVAKAEEIFDAHKENIESIPASIRLSVLANQVKHAETEELVSLYLDCYVKTNDGNFRRQLAAALSNTKEKATVERILGELKNKDVVKPQDLAMSWYRPFLNKDFSQGAFWNWACENWDWITSALGGDMSFDKFVIYPANTFKTPERLEEYKAFFEPQLDDMAISRNITMGIKEISARINLINTSKAAVESALAEL